MNVQELKEGDGLTYIDRDSVARKGVVLRNRTTESGNLFLTVQDEQERVTVLRDSKKVVSIA